MIKDATGCYMDHWNPHTDGELTRQNFEKKLIQKYKHRFRASEFSAGWYLEDHIHHVAKGDAVFKGKVEINVRQPESGEQVKYILNSGDILYMPAFVVHDSGVLEDTLFYDSSK